MSTVRQKRKSCEACRARKLKCSGKDTGCSRCVHLGLVCKFHDKGMPGRPRKWSLVDTRDPRPLQSIRQDGRLGDHGAHDVRTSDRRYHQHGADPQASSHTQSILFADGSSVAPSVSTSTDNNSLEQPDWASRGSHDVVFSGDEFGTLPLLDFDSTELLDSLPLDSFRACLSNGVPHQDPTATTTTTTATETLPNTLITPPAPQEPCDCAKQVFEVIRTLNSDPVSHGTVHTLRMGTDIFNQLLTCPRCYDVSKPPRVTLQNVLLIGRLSLQVTTGYQAYLRWLKDYCTSLAERNMSDTVYLIPDINVHSPLGFNIRSDKFYEIITLGLQSDAERLSDLGRKFAARQHNRHLIGHEACPDSDGRCWKDRDAVDPDPSDICPQSVAARALIPCYRVVDEVRSKIQQFEDAVT